MTDVDVLKGRTHHLKNRDSCDIRFPLVLQPCLGHISPIAEIKERIIDITITVPTQRVFKMNIVLHRKRDETK